MRFSAAHRFSATPETIAAVLRDPAFYEHLELPDLRLIEAAGSGDTRVVLRYEFTGHLDPLAQRLLGGQRLTWTQEVTLDGANGGALAFRAEANPRMLHGEARFVLQPDGETATQRLLEGELVVAIPVVGSVAERRIVPGVLARLDAEADALERRLS